MHITPGPDGNLSRHQAALLCGVSDRAITNWIHRGYCLRGTRTRVYLEVAAWDGPRPRLDPVAVAKAKYATDERARRPGAPLLAAVA